MTRELSDWLDGYLEYVEMTEPSDLYKKWVGVSVIASCLQRKCYMLWDEHIYPNMYIILVGKTAARKSTAMRPGGELIRKMRVPLAAESTTREALIRAIGESIQQMIDPVTNLPIFHSSITLFHSELAVFMGSDRVDKQMLLDLTHLYDCPDPWKYDTKHEGTDDIQCVWFNLLGAITPEMVKRCFPREAIGGGLTGRMIFVYASGKGRTIGDPTLYHKRQAELKEPLIADLEYISMLSGEFKPTDEYKRIYVDWYENMHDGKDKEREDTPFKGERDLEGYVGRRPTHVKKLSIMMSASRGDDKILTADDFFRAYNLLKETEEVMPYSFKAFGKVEPQELMALVMDTVARAGRIMFSQLVAKYQNMCMARDMFEIVRSMNASKFTTMQPVGGDDWVIRVLSKEERQNLLSNSDIGLASPELEEGGPKVS
ncbi:hypothetical protein LCGC14_0949780 [marine sediment metagenome]|uniref:Uncharacterized protein n=1 Tax=marine sediment metagenome TaxID=412755 RepID=A0A0F9NME5_9ZZZZ